MMARTKKLTETIKDAAVSAIEEERLSYRNQDHSGPIIAHPFLPNSRRYPLVDSRSDDCGGVNHPQYGVIEFGSQGNLIHS